MRPAELGDRIGAATLERMATAPRYNRWMFDRVGRWIGNRVLEIGAGIGNLSHFLEDRERVVVTDAEPHYLDRLRERFACRANVRVAELRLPTIDPELIRERFDTVICFNVLEHVEDDRGPLVAMRQLLDPGGRVIVLVPALPSLYGALDGALGHYRRYTPAQLAGKLSAVGLTVRHVEYFNLAGIPGWWFTGRVLKWRLIPRGALRCYDALVPLFRLETLLPWRVGQSLIGVGEVPN